MYRARDILKNRSLCVNAKTTKLMVEIAFSLLCRWQKQQLVQAVKKCFDFALIFSSFLADCSKLKIKTIENR